MSEIKFLFRNFSPLYLYFTNIMARYYSLFFHILDYFLNLCSQSLFEDGFETMLHGSTNGREQVWCLIWHDSLFGVTEGHSRVEKSWREMCKMLCLKEASSMMKLPTTATLSGGLNGFGRGTKVTCNAL